MNELYEVAAQPLVIARTAADRTDFDVSMVRIGVFHFVVRAGSHPIELSIARRRSERHALELLGGKR